MALSRHGRDFAYVGTLGERAIAQVRAPAGPRRRAQAVPGNDQPRQERKTIGALFIDLFEAEAKKTALSRRKATLGLRSGPTAFRRRCRAAWPPRWAAGP